MEDYSFPRNPSEQLQQNRKLQDSINTADQEISTLGKKVGELTKNIEGRETNLKEMRTQREQLRDAKQKLAFIDLEREMEREIATLSEERERLLDDMRKEYMHISSLKREQTSRLGRDPLYGNSNIAN